MPNYARAATEGREANSQTMDSERAFRELEGAGRFRRLDPASSGQVSRPAKSPARRPPTLIILWIDAGGPSEVEIFCLDPTEFAVSQ